MPKRISYDVKNKTTRVEEYIPSEEELKQQSDAKIKMEKDKLKNINRLNLEEELGKAINKNNIFLKLENITEKDLTEQIKSVTKQMNGLIMLVINKLDEI